MKSKHKKGQGVVEYAGALVIAALVVTAITVAGPGRVSTMFNSVITAVSGKLTGAL